MKNKIRFFAVAFATILLAFLPTLKANAKDLDRIRNYTINVTVNADATLNLYYHIEWEVLDSTSEGPLEWVEIGIPNNRTVTYSAKTSNISSIKTSSSSGSHVRIDLDRKYKAGEIVVFEFELVQDYMYQMNRDEEGYTVYEFTPGWFDEIKVDKAEVIWDADKVSNWSPTCIQDGGKLSWSSTLGHGEKMSVSVTYPNDAFAFDSAKTIETRSSGSDGDDAGAFVGLVVVVLIVIICIAANNSQKYKSGASLGTQYDKKITRTKVTYYANCPGCGAVREEGKETCAYCGRSMIQSEEKIEEKDVPKEDKGKYDNDGLFSYNSVPNTYVRVHVTRVPRPVTRSTYSGSSRSSCAHSSCACACACACAGGGRAGCSVKDFYNTNLKLKDLMLRKKNSKKS